MEEAKTKRSHKVIAIASVLIFAVLVGMIIVHFEYKDNQVNETIEHEIIETEEADKPTQMEFYSKDGYNTVKLSYHNLDKTPLKLDISNIKIENGHGVEYTIEEANKLGLVGKYLDRRDGCSFILKNNHKFSGDMNPIYVDSIEKWSDSKANLPFEVKANTGANGRMTTIDITLDYNSDIISTSVDTNVFDIAK